MRVYTDWSQVRDPFPADTPYLDPESNCTAEWQERTCEPTTKEQLQAELARWQTCCEQQQKEIERQHQGIAYLRRANKTLFHSTRHPFTDYQRNEVVLALRARADWLEDQDYVLDCDGLRIMADRIERGCAILAWLPPEYPGGA